VAVCVRDRGQEDECKSESLRKRGGPVVRAGTREVELEYVCKSGIKIEG